MSIIRQSSSKVIASTSKTMFTRPISTSIITRLPPRSSKTSFSRPAPPSLPVEDQAEFDALLKANAAVGATPTIAQLKQGDIQSLEHRDLRRGPKKDFEGEVNPKTGEEGGPKTDPFIAGDNDWQYGGRVTDF